MIFGYLIVVFTRSIVIWIEHAVMPVITNRIVDNNVVLKTLHDEVVKERDENFDQYEEQRKRVRGFSKTIDEQLLQIKEKDKDIASKNIKLSEKEKEIFQKENEITISNKLVEKLTTEKKEALIEIDKLVQSNRMLQIDYENSSDERNKYAGFFFNELNEDFYDSAHKFTPEIIAKVRELKENKRWESFLKIGKFHTSGGSIGGELQTEMAEKELVYEREDKRRGLTPIGNIIWKYRDVLKSVV